MNTSFTEDTIYGKVVSESRIGGRKENQDCYGCKQTSKGLLLVVCDGMGGTNGGRFASQLATETILNEFEHGGEMNNAELLVRAIKIANRVVYDKARANSQLNGMGTTGTVLLINDKCAIAAHVGDSRIYQLRKNKKVFRTNDHSQVFELVKRGTITEEQARLSAESNIILRSIGTQPDIDVEVGPELPYLKGDRFLLCSDGICGAIEEETLLKHLTKNKDSEDTVKKLSDTIDKVGIEGGGKHDNLTSTLIQVKKDSKLKPKKNYKAAIKWFAACIVAVVLTVMLFSIKSEKTVAKHTITTIGNNTFKEYNAALNNAKEIKADYFLINLKIETKDNNHKWITNNLCDSIKTQNDITILAFIESSGKNIIETSKIAFACHCLYLSEDGRICIASSNQKISQKDNYAELIKQNPNGNPIITKNNDTIHVWRKNPSIITDSLNDDNLFIISSTESEKMGFSNGTFENLDELLKKLKLKDINQKSWFSSLFQKVKNNN